MSRRHPDESSRRRPRADDVEDDDQPDGSLFGSKKQRTGLDTYQFRSKREPHETSQHSQLPGGRSTGSSHTAQAPAREAGQDLAEAEDMNTANDSASVTGDSQRQRTSSDIFQFVPSKDVSMAIERDVTTGRDVFKFRGDVPATGNWISEDTAKGQFVVHGGEDSKHKALEMVKAAVDKLEDGQILHIVFWPHKDNDGVTQGRPSSSRVHIEHDQVLPKNWERDGKETL